MKQRLSVKPFADWLSYKVDKNGLQQTSFDTGISIRDIRCMSQCVNRERKKIEYISLATVDKAVTNDGSINLQDLYPDLYV